MALNLINGNSTSVEKLDNNIKIEVTDELLNKVDEIYNSTYYKSGDIFKYESSTQTFHANGLITTNATNIRFDIYLPKKLDNISEITMVSGNFIGRSASGGYINNLSNGFNLGDSGISISVIKREGNRITLSITSSTGFTNVTNNTPVSFEIRNYEFNFN